MIALATTISSQLSILSQPHIYQFFSLYGGFSFTHSEVQYFITLTNKDISLYVTHEWQSLKWNSVHCMEICCKEKFCSMLFANLSTKVEWLPWAKALSNEDKLSHGWWFCPHYISAAVLQAVQSYDQYRYSSVSCFAKHYDRTTGICHPFPFLDIMQWLLTCIDFSLRLL